MYGNFFKRLFDFLLSLIALSVLSPILLILIIVGAIAMKGNPFFTQLRPGKISKQMIEQKTRLVVGTKVDTSDVIESPGTKYAHYMPKCDMAIIKTNMIEKGISTLTIESFVIKGIKKYF